MNAARATGTRPPTSASPSPRGVGAGDPRPARPERRRERPRRRLRHRPGHRDADRAPARGQRRRRRRLGGDGREGARGAARRRTRRWSADLTELELDEPVDVVFSSAVFHWVARPRRALRAACARRCRPGGRLAAQCGGAGNIARCKPSSAEVAAREPYARPLRGLRRAVELRRRRRRPRSACAPPASPRRAAWLQPKDVTPPEPAEFLRTVCLGPHMDRLPEELREPFVAEVLALEDEPAGPRLRPPQHRARRARLSRRVPRR